jgi:hypothetical protein
MLVAEPRDAIVGALRIGIQICKQRAPIRPCGQRRIALQRLAPGLRAGRDALEELGGSLARVGRVVSVANRIGLPIPGDDGIACAKHAAQLGRKGGLGRERQNARRQGFRGGRSLEFEAQCQCAPRHAQA